MLFLDQDVDAPVGRRLDRWISAYRCPGDIYLPLVMVDSGDRISNGSQSFEAVYSRIIDSALRRRASASLAATGELADGLLRIDVRLTNHSGTTLSVENDATIHVLVWEELSDPDSIPVVARAATTPITTLADGNTAELVLEVQVGNLDPDLLRWVVIADYRPVGTGYPFDTLQALAGP